MIKQSLLTLCLEQMRAVNEVMEERYTAIGFELWKRLEPILRKLSDEMKEKSRYKGFSVWVLEDIPYDFILVERIEKNTGVLGLRVGLRSWGKFISETFYIPAEVEGMEWDGVVKWAIEHDSIVVPPGWKKNEDGSIERDVTCSVFMGRATYR